MSKRPRKPASGVKRRQISQREAQRYFKVRSAAQFVPPKDEAVPHIDFAEEIDPDDVDAPVGVKSDPARRR